MSQSLSPELTAKAKRIIDEALEPKIKKILEEANKLLNKHGIQLGVEVQWFIDKKE